LAVVALLRLINAERRHKEFLRLQASVLVFPFRQVCEFFLGRAVAEGFQIKCIVFNQMYGFKSNVWLYPLPIT